MEKRDCLLKEFEEGGSEAELMHAVCTSAHRLSQSSLASLVSKVQHPRVLLFKLLANFSPEICFNCMRRQ